MIHSPQIQQRPRRTARVRENRVRAGPSSIGDYAAIGDCRSVALVSRHGSVDWFCSPVFSAPSIFGALLDEQHGGQFLLAAAGDTLRGLPEQQYEPHSNVLRTTFHCTTGKATVTDFMAVAEAGAASSAGDTPQQLVRLVRCDEGEVELVGEVRPRPGYASQPVQWHHERPGVWRCETAATRAGRWCPIDRRISDRIRCGHS